LLASGLKTRKLNVLSIVICIDARYYGQVKNLLGNPAKAEQKLGWKRIKKVREICLEIVAEDLSLSHQNFSLPNYINE
tara:strand:+ start:808 stop:1041 length:234 start_codon:yes stop_codon:yes gene_type:complete